MDLIKIGKYIAGKRKRLGLTQKQLAEKLGMSDKSVSKWERGICLPDVSVYLELCGILGISINEFLAGEDISEENIRKKSDDTLIQVTKDSRCRQKYLKRTIAVLGGIIVFAVSLLGFVLYPKFTGPENYVAVVAPDSPEMKTAELLSGIDGAFLFRYFTEDVYQTLTLYMSEYRSGELTAKSKIAEFMYSDLEPVSEGMIAVVPDFEQFEVRLVVTDDYAKYSTVIPILGNVEGRAYLGRSASRIETDKIIKEGTEQGLLALIYGKDGVSGVPVSQIESGEIGVKNDYIYYFSFQFQS